MPRKKDALKNVHCFCMRLWYNIIYDLHTWRKNTIAIGKKEFQLYKKYSNYTTHTFKWCHYFFTVLMNVKGSMCLLQTGLQTIGMRILLSCNTVSACDAILLSEKSKMTFYSTSLDKTGRILSSQSRTLLLRSVSFKYCCAS